ASRPRSPDHSPTDCWAGARCWRGRPDPEVFLDDGRQAVERAERVHVGFPVDGDVILTLAGSPEREDLDRDVRARARAAAGTTLAKPHALAQPALGNELRQVPQDGLGVDASRAAAARDREHHDAALAGTDGDHDPARGHARASAAASRAAATTGG